LEASRPATTADLPRMVELAEHMRGELVAMRGGAIWGGREAHVDPEAAYASMLERPDAHVVVGTIDGVVVGFAAVTLERLHGGEAIGVITDLYVEPPAREVGVGEALTIDLIAFCEARHCVGIDALALPGHRSTKNFFEESGFTARAIVMHRRSLELTGENFDSDEDTSRERRS
jgi:GNAT superfamily N-acetyltransferase